MKTLCVLLLTLSLPGAAADARPDPAALIDSIAAELDPRVVSALARIEGTDRRLLALRGYLRAGAGLTERWSWTAAQIADFGKSPEHRAIEAEIDQVRQAFVTANPGYQLWVNPEVRSLDTQIATWNRNDSVSRAGAGLLSALRKWQQSAAIKALPAADTRSAARKFLTGFVPAPTPTLAAPGLSPHGQMRAIDFHIKQGARTVAGPSTATIAADWDAAGWAAKLKAAVRAGSRHFTGPLEIPREPWHYTYSPVPAELP